MSHDQTAESRPAVLSGDFLLFDLAVWQMRAEDPLPSVPNGYRHNSNPRKGLTH